MFIIVLDLLASLNKYASDNLLVGQGLVFGGRTIIQCLVLLMTNGFDEIKLHVLWQLMPSEFIEEERFLFSHSVYLTFCASCSG
jgi:hypothetical protein